MLTKIKKKLNQKRAISDQTYGSRINNILSVIGSRKMKRLMDFETKIINDFSKITDQCIKDDIHVEYCKIQREWNEPILRSLGKHVNLPANKMMVIGSFLGLTESALSPYYENIIGVDIENFHLPNLPQNIEFYQSDIDQSNWTLPEDFFDTVMMVEVLEHLLWSPVPLLKWIAKHCSTFVVTTPDDKEWPALNLKPYMRYCHFSTIPNAIPGAPSNPEPMTHCKQYTQVEFIELLDFCGFKVVELQRVGNGSHQMMAICSPR